MTGRASFSERGARAERVIQVSQIREVGYSGSLKLKFPIEISGRVLPFWNFIAIESKLLPFYPSDKGNEKGLTEKVPILPI